MFIRIKSFLLSQIECVLIKFLTQMLKIIFTSVLSKLPNEKPRNWKLSIKLNTLTATSNFTRPSLAAAATTIKFIPVWHRNFMASYLFWQSLFCINASFSSGNHGNSFRAFHADCNEHLICTREIFRSMATHKNIFSHCHITR